MAKIDLDSVARALSGRVDEPIVNQVVATDGVIPWNDRRQDD